LPARAENALYKTLIQRKLHAEFQHPMRKLIFVFASIAAVAGLAGCAGPERKLSRGIDNTLEIVRWGDMRQGIEQGAVFSSPDVSYTHGTIHGFDQSMKRVGLGLIEVVTFPFPPYKPILTKYVPASPQYPDSYQPGLMADPLFETDTFIGFSGGDVAPFVPGSRFTVFED
jgi:putative exosortase-associated protein (TIGR04073 family)